MTGKNSKQIHWHEGATNLIQDAFSLKVMKTIRLTILKNVIKRIETRLKLNVNNLRRCAENSIFVSHGCKLRSKFILDNCCVRNRRWASPFFSR